MARQYTDDEKTSALAVLTANGGNITHTAAQTGIPATTIRKWRDLMQLGKLQKVKIVEPAPVTHQECEQKRDSLASRLERLAHLLLDDILDDPERKATLAGKMTCFGIAVDKMQLLRGAPTSIAGKVEELTNEQRILRLRELAERGRARRLGIIDADGESRVGPSERSGDDAAASG